MTVLPTSRRLLALVAVGATALALAGCGSGGSSPSATASLGNGAARANAGTGFGQGRAPGVSGLIAAIQGKTLQVQSTTEQTAVTYTAKTTITAQVAAKADDVKVGDCVSARSADTTGTASAPPSAAATGTSTVAAATVTILSSDGKGCTNLTSGFRGGFDGAPGGFNGTRPSGAPTGRPSNFASGAASGRFQGGRGFGGFGAVGEVTAVSSGSFTVSETRRAFDRTGSSPSPSPSASTRPVTVTFTSGTTFEKTAKATAKAIKVGGCVRAFGRADDTGAVTATSLALSTAVNGVCTSVVRGG